MTVISAEALRAGAPVEIVRVDLWDGHHAYVKGMTAKEKNDFDASMMTADMMKIDRKRVKNQKFLMVCRCLCDEAGSRLLTDEDVSAVKQWPGKVLNHVFDKCNELAGGGTDSSLFTSSDSDETDDD